MKQEVEEGFDTEFGSDEWLKQSCEMEFEEKKPKIELNIAKNIKVESGEVFGSDRLGKQSVETETRVENNTKPRVQVMHAIKRENNNISNKTNVRNSFMNLKKCNKEEQIQRTKMLRVILTDVLKTNVTGYTISPREGVSMDQSTISEYASTGLCTFRCPTCFAIYTNWKKFQNHMKSKHKTVISMKQIQSFMTKATVHICRICSEELYCETKIFSNHFLSKHKLSVSEYRKTYGSDSISCRETLDKVLENARLSPDCIGNLCTFKCPKCHKIFENSKMLRNHNTDSDKCLNKVNTKPRDCLQDVVTHRCKICLKLLLCTKEDIRKHISYTHRITSLRDYASQTGCTIDNVFTRSIKNMREIISNNNIELQLVGNFCKYTCDRCSHVTTRWLQFRRHMKQRHDCQVSKLLSKHITETVLHICVICQKKVLSDWQFLQSHLKSVHNTTIPKYVKDYKLKQVKTTATDCHKKNQGDDL